MSAKNQLTIENIACIRGDNHLFSALNIHVENGELLRVRGENGSGKTSLLKIISGITEPDDGKIYWNNENIKTSYEFTKNIAYLAHRDGIKSELTAIENLDFYQNFYMRDNSASLSDILEALDLSHTSYIKAGQLSFGQRRRLAFARLLLSPAKLWLLDEPFTGIDVIGRQILEQHCINFLDKDGIIIMTHHAEIENPILAKLERSIEIGQ
jgi:heme exporter protein A